MFRNLLFYWYEVVFLSPVPQVIGPTVQGSSYCLFNVIAGYLCNRSPLCANVEDMP